MTHRLCETVKTKEWFSFLNCPEQQPGSDPAEKTGHDPHNKRHRSQCGTVYDQLRIQQDRAHHKGSQPFLPHSASGKRSCQRDCPIHAQRRRNPKKARRHDPQQPHPALIHGTEQPMDPFFKKNGYTGPKQDTNGPIAEDLPELHIKIVPDIDEFPMQDLSDFTHRYLPSDRSGCPVRYLLHAPAHGPRCGIPYG